MSYSSRYSMWPAYVSVAERKAKAAEHVKKEEKKGKKFSPVIIEGKAIAKTFWGKAWCENLEAYSDYENRLPRGRTYVRNGSVVDLQITKGKIAAQVMGSDLYRVTITIQPLPELKWKALIKGCAGKIDSLIELLQGKFSKSVMEIITQKDEGLFPKSKEISMKCSCPDSAGMCKHIAAVLYGIGASLDFKPENLFVLRHVDHAELISSATKNGTLLQNSGSTTIEDSELSELFGIEMETDASMMTSVSTPPVTLKPKRQAKTITMVDSVVAPPPKKVTKVKTQTSKATTKAVSAKTKAVSAKTKAVSAKTKATVAKIAVAKIAVTDDSSM